MQHTTPPGWHSVTPRIFVEEPQALINLLKQCFDARGDYQPGRPAEIHIGDSIVMIADAVQRSVFSAYLYVYVENVDSTYEKAKAAGVEVIEEPQETPYGDRRCTVRDKWGNVWQTASCKQ